METTRLKSVNQVSGAFLVTTGTVITQLLPVMKLCIYTASFIIK